jgi:hypothetical protein
MAVPIDWKDYLNADQRWLPEESGRSASEVLRPAAAELDLLSPEEVIPPDSRLWDVLREGIRVRVPSSEVPKERGAAPSSIYDGRRLLLPGGLNDD